MVRGNRTYFAENFGLNNPSNLSIISIVSEGEIRAFAMQNNWGGRKWQIARNLIEEFPPININDPRIIERYAEIDTFSKGKLIGRPLVGSARTMGKNDLWIAATASVLDATLITTDKDFSHLNAEFLRVAYVEPSLIV
jgi:tRNA(fMet)-specific endonuclease VapC